MDDSKRYAVSYIGTLVGGIVASCGIIHDSLMLVFLGTLFIVFGFDVFMMATHLRKWHKVK